MTTAMSILIFAAIYFIVGIVKWLVIGKIILEVSKEKTEEKKVVRYGGDDR